MSVLEPFRRNGGPDKVSQWIAHHPLVMAVIFGGAIFLFDVVSVPDVVTIVWLVVFILSFSAYMRASFAHGKGFCDRCASRPYGGERAATRYRRTLKYYHRLMMPRTWVGMSLPLVCLVVLMTLSLTVIPTGWAHAVGFTLPLWAYTGLSGYGTRIHTWLRPWCRRCRGDDDGWYEFTEVPDPKPSGSKVA